MVKDNIKKLSLYDTLNDKILKYRASIWKDRRDDKIDDWLENFADEADSEEIAERKRLNALFLLSKFMYFGNIEMRELLISLYRDLFKYPIIHKIRKNNSDTTDLGLIENLFRQELLSTRFLGIGNPSESGVHLLYYFRQENNLHKDYFINTHEIFDLQLEKKDDSDDVRINSVLKDEKITRYIFIDDICGSGTQAKAYSSDIVKKIKSLNSNIEVIYLMLFGTEVGIKHIKDNTDFDRVESVFTIDESFKAFSDTSRYFTNSIKGTPIEKNYCKGMCQEYGSKLWSSCPLGYKDGQLLLSLFHNTPDNTLPIFWRETSEWKAMFKRYNKIY